MLFAWKVANLTGKADKIAIVTDSSIGCGNLNSFIPINAICIVAIHAFSISQGEEQYCDVFMRADLE